MSGFESDVANLLSSKHYQQLAVYKPPFDPIEVLGISGRELSYSNVLSWLLCNRANRDFRRRFILNIAERLDFDIDAHRDERIEVRREFGDQEAGRTDVYVNFPDVKLAVAIEAKVWAKEGGDQIRRYQDFLVRECPHYCAKVVIFLTPLGDKPNSADGLSDTPVLSMSWGEIADLIGKCSGNGEEHDFRNQFARHLYRSVLVDRNEERRLVIDLLKEGNNAETIKRIVENLPHLGQYCTEWKRIAAEVIGVDHVDNKEELELFEYPTRGETKRELKVSVPKWNESGLPFRLMLYSYQSSGVRVLVHDDDYNREKTNLAAFARLSGGLVGCFPKVRGWTAWHSVLAVDGDAEEPRDTLILKEIFDDDFWYQAQKSLEQQLKPLLPHVREWLKCR